jgi:phenylalanyl-tRNA synthetase alpha chain
MSRETLAAIARIEASARAAIAAGTTAAALREVRNGTIGESTGELTKILRSVKDVAPEFRKDVGREGNEAKRRIAEALESRERALESAAVAAALASERVDPTQPGPRRPLGHEHPVKAVLRELEELFESMGFTVVDGPEVESDYYNFEALNLPPDHPARDTQDTFYVEGGAVLRTHTSGMQIRAMRAMGAPLRVVAPGRVFRNEQQDASHEHTFHQIEGLLVDEGISVAHLKGVLDEMLGRLFRLRREEKVVTRLRPHHFPFVEPGFELDFQCRLCNGKGCATCKQSGWIELCGCGMVHPKVLAAGNVDPERFTGFAFGLGVDRVTMMRHAVSDIRWFTSGDLRFLGQF